MPPAPIDPVVRPELPAPVVIVEPTHGVVLLLGAGIPINGLMPALLISVAPRGTTPPLSLVVTLAPGFDSGEAIPTDETAPDEESEQLLEAVTDPMPDPMPPPSNDDVVPRVPDAIPPAIPDEDESIPAQLELLNVLEVLKLLEPLDVGPIGIGPKPPGLISVAPSGIPVAVLEVEPRMPSGDVPPIPGVVMRLCAKPTWQLKRIAVAAMNNRLI
jgi:hypothetical protein